MNSGGLHGMRGKVAALIPAYREAAHIQDVARRTRAQLDRVLVVDDGSPDTTAREARGGGAEVIVHQQNSGKGAAVKTGVRHLIADPDIEYILLLDGDGQHLPEEIPRFLEAAAASDAPFFVGSRMADVRTMPLVRKLTNWTMSAIISRACGQKIPDTQCGFRMLHRDLAPHVFGETNAFDYETEMLLLAAGRGARIESVPVSTVYGEERSKIRPIRDTIKFLKLMNRYRRARGTARPLEAPSQARS
jgi:glycosyltransferase involved in cell wall biosynthesis